MRVAIIGMGVLGKAQARMFSKHELVTYDIADGLIYPSTEIDECDFAIICVGTPADETGRANLVYLHDAFSQLHPSLPVLIRSTVPPGTINVLQHLSPSQLVCHSPEFLHERAGAAWPESTDVPYMILGGTVPAREFFSAKMVQVFPGIIYECSALEAELAKYTANLYWAARVTFVNEMANICAAFGADWENVREAWLNDPRIKPEYTRRRGFPPGFDGRCWPKDISALIMASSDAGYEPEFLQAVQEANERFRS